MTAAPGPDGSNKFQRYRSNQRQRGLKLLRLWVADPHAPGFREEARRQTAVVEGRLESNVSDASPGLKRGDIVSVAPGVPGKKSRRAVIVQSDGLPGTENVLACHLVRPTQSAPLYRLPLRATGSGPDGQGYEVAAERIVTVPRDRCETVLGRLDPADVAALNRLLAQTLGLAD